MNNNPLIKILIPDPETLSDEDRAEIADALLQTTFMMLDGHAPAVMQLLGERMKDMAESMRDDISTDSSKCDVFAALHGMPPKDVPRMVRRLAQMIETTGVHVISASETLSGAVSALLKLYSKVPEGVDDSDDSDEPSDS